MNLRSKCHVTILSLLVAQVALYPEVAGECGPVSVTNRWRGGYSLGFGIPIKALTDRWGIEIKFSAPVTLKVWDAKSATTDNHVFQLVSYPYNQRLLAGSVLTSVGVNVFYSSNSAPPDVDSVTFNGQPLCNGRIAIASTKRATRNGTPTTDASVESTKVTASPTFTPATAATEPTTAAWTTTSHQTIPTDPALSTRSITTESMTTKLTTSTSTSSTTKAAISTKRMTKSTTSAKRVDTTSSTKRWTTSKRTTNRRPTTRISILAWVFSLFHFP